VKLVMTMTSHQQTIDSIPNMNTVVDFVILLLKEKRSLISFGLSIFVHVNSLRSGCSGYFEVL
jgi:hypothetical protein